ncbi:ribosomal RNA-processing protein 7 homolog A-like [Oppia nitens]|uniref:ribosomal RNA-processing protein 7 homolog A-like n=1 Tax=Oppia nitens TaxID=1686743 RepID=UPI0023DBC903|nr:ribosomal RNA-processing protein 7 homolog A-like [Oppia nitens]
MTATDNTVVDGYTVLNVKYSADSQVIRQLFLKEFNAKQTPDESSPTKKSCTLIVLNVPPFADPLVIRHLFSNCGNITDISFNDRPVPPKKKSDNKSKYFDKTETINGYKVAFVEFANRSALQKALNLNKSSANVPTLRPESKQYTVGLMAMKCNYNNSIVDPQELKKEINDFMSDYDKRVEEERLKAKETDGVPDADGWVKVDRHSKSKKRFASDHSRDEKLIEKHNKRLKKTNNSLVNFYSFQQKESKIEYLAQLRNRFEEDKRRIALMKAQRKFKPL